MGSRKTDHDRIKCEVSALRDWINESGKGNITLSSSASGVFTLALVLSFVQLCLMLRVPGPQLCRQTTKAGWSFHIVSTKLEYQGTKLVHGVHNIILHAS